MSEPSAPGLRIIIGPDPPVRLDKALVRDVPEQAALSRSRLMRLIVEGAVSRAGEALEARARVAAGDAIDIRLDPPAQVRAEPQAIALAVVWEDDDLIVIDKPAGLVVHPGAGNPEGTLVNALLYHCGAGLSGIGGVLRPGIVHRIDKDTSGLLVVAKSDRAHQGLAAQFEAHSVNRQYLALVHGVPSLADPRLRGVRGVALEAGGVIRIATQLDRHRSDRQRQAVVVQGGRHAITRLRMIECFGAPPVVALVACWLETGRTHQIRVHLAHVGHGLVGDPVYGGRRKVSARALGDAAAAVEGFGRQALHAATLGFVHPVSNAPMHFESPLPHDLSALLAGLRAPDATLP